MTCPPKSQMLRVTSPVESLALDPRESCFLLFSLAARNSWSTRGQRSLGTLASASWSAGEAAATGSVTKAGAFFSEVLAALGPLRGDREPPEEEAEFAGGAFEVRKATGSEEFCEGWRISRAEFWAKHSLYSSPASGVTAEKEKEGFWLGAVRRKPVGTAGASFTCVHVLLEKVLVITAAIFVEWRSGCPPRTPQFRRTSEAPRVGQRVATSREGTRGREINVGRW